MVLPIILAAGRGTRMHSTQPKALTQLQGIPFILHVLETIKEITDEKPIIVVGYKGEAVQQEVGRRNADYCYQVEQKGTGHALLQTKELVQTRGQDQTLLVLYADVPLVSPQTLTALIETHQRERSDLTFLTTQAQNPTGLGRIVAEAGKIDAIVEEADATPAEKRICRVYRDLPLSSWKPMRARYPVGLWIPGRPMPPFP